MSEIEILNHNESENAYILWIQCNNVFLTILKHITGDYAMLYHDVEHDYSAWITDENLEYLVKRISSYARNLQKESN